MKDRIDRIQELYQEYDDNPDMTDKDLIIKVRGVIYSDGY